MKVLETDHWCLILPAEWWAEYDDDVVRIVDKDDVGEIEITTLCKQTGDITADELRSMAANESPEVTQWTPISIGAFEGVNGRFVEDDANLREFYVSAGSVLLYITYLCHEDDAGMDDAPVEELLGTLVAGEAGGATAAG